jgi:hypothetical protein
MPLTKTHYTSLLNIYATIDHLIEKLRLKGRYEAYEWMRIHKPTVFKGNPLEATFDKSFNKKACNKEIIKQFQSCYEQTCQFLQQYLQENFGLKSPSPSDTFTNCLTARIITSQETVTMLALVENFYDLCHECNNDGDHYVSNDLVEYYNTLHAIMHRISIP